MHTQVLVGIEHWQHRWAICAAGRHSRDETVPNLVMRALHTSGAARGAAACQIMLSDADGAESVCEFWRRPAHVLRHARAVQAVAAGNEPGLLTHQREHE